ncbi:hypothetical protein PRIPAC_78449 [Pristionchus pacificus]|uniref:G protein-coupled receptor n=1 Tax=Pristionchus pacificus TaxID=54126 RepID=A0A2A6CQG9_PRIPA|nr:hypothetical protein PRIPAC_78449 [Pristionchus pacificus]|eukprot:PDM80281.1 G protein-coupled receptor [Pristionchus pacificus]
MSDKTRRLQRKLMHMLLALVPINILVIPLGVQAYSMIAMALTPDITNIFYCIQMKHTPSCILL